MYYWYSSTNTDAVEAYFNGEGPKCLSLVTMHEEGALRLGARFTCFTSTKVQILTSEEAGLRNEGAVIPTKMIELKIDQVQDMTGCIELDGYSVAKLQH